MASIDPSLISDHEERKWVDEISKILTPQLEIAVQTRSPSVFYVPETITTTKPEAYEPQQIGLGPYHHFQPLPYKKMEQKKLSVIVKVQWDNDIKDFVQTVVNKVEKIVPFVRSYYDMFLKGDDEYLSWIFTIDGIFLLDLLHTYNYQPEIDMQEYLYNLKNIIEEKIEKNKEGKNEEKLDLSPLEFYKEVFVNEYNRFEWEHAFNLPHYEPELPKVEAESRFVAQDIMMVENQVPFRVLEEIYEALHSSSGSTSHSVKNNYFSPSKFYDFCKIHSPLNCSKSQAFDRVDHLLHYMYYSIVNNVPRKPTKPVAATRISIQSVAQLVDTLPIDEIGKAYGQMISILENFSQSEPVIPSASELHDKAGFRFYTLDEDQGIKYIRVSGKDVYLPTFTLNIDSEVILRNLVAYETLTAKPNSFLLTEFMFLMCALVVNVDDVKRLKNVIKGELDASEVVELFTGISSSLPDIKIEEKSSLTVMINEINMVYNSRLRMKPYLLLKKLASWLLSVLKFTSGFVESSWKIVAFIVSIVTVVFLTLQAYCDVYGCKK